ncbi:MAG: hypothetical protein QM764_00490 [Chitinophagaceae bacterium]
MTRRNLAPIILLTYKRLNTVTQTIEALKGCTLASESDLYIFADGAKGVKDQAQVDAVQSYLNTVKHETGFRSISLCISPVNRGISKSIIDSTNKIFKQSDRVIVLEDDIVVTKNFLVFMNDNLDKYKDNKTVFSISGYNYPFKTRENESLDAFFLPRSCSWGWATWKDRWVDIDWEIKSFKDFSENKSQIREFSQAGSDLFRLLNKQYKKDIDVWDVRWVYNQFQQKGITIYPIISKVKNVGFGQDATNTNTVNRYVSKLDDGQKESFKLPENISSDEYYQRQLIQFYSIFSRIKSRLKTMFYKTISFKNPLYFFTYIFGLKYSVGIENIFSGI